MWVAGGQSTTTSSDTSSKVVTVLDNSKGEDRTTEPRIDPSSHIPQVDGTEDKKEELSSRVWISPLSADNFCTGVLLHPVHPRTFSWLVMDPVITLVFREIIRQK